MEFVHEPVLYKQCLECLNIREDKIYVDATMGGGGHSKGIFKKLSGKGTLIGIDQDNEAVEHNKKWLKQERISKRVIIKKGNFENIDKLIKEENIKKVDGILMDLGVSSYQLDNAKRGFSYRHDAPLDMRMDIENDITAEIIVNSYSKDELTAVIKKYGEERWAVRIASAIIRERKRTKIETTRQLAQIVKNAIPASMRRTGPHPARRTFQALRIEVNRELEVLERSIEKAVSMLSARGRLCIITFHSLEDRIVKNLFREMENPCTCPKEFPVCICGKKPAVKVITRKPIVPGENEVKANSRARSAKLRAAEKI